MSETYSSATDWVGGHGVTISIGSTTGLCVKSIGDISMSATKIDTTCHNSTSNAKSYISGLIDIADIPVTIRFNKTTVDAFQTTMTSAFQTPQSVVITFPFTTAETCTFDAIVTGVSIPIPDDDGVTAVITLTPTSIPTWSTST